MESSIGDEDSNYPSFDISDHFNQLNGNIEKLSIDEDQRNDKLSDHNGLHKEKIPRVGLRITKEFKKPINQSIHCNREGFRKSRVRAVTQKNTIAAMRCRARILTSAMDGLFYVDPYNDRRMWVSIFFNGEFWADNVLGNKEQKELKDDATDSNEVIPCASSSAIERQFQHGYTSDMFRKVQTEFGKNGDCTIRAFAKEGDSVYVKVEEEKLVNEKTRYVTYGVHFDRLTEEVQCECNMFESSGILYCHCLAVFSSYKINRIPTFYVLPRWSKNIKRKHTYIKSSHNVSHLDESHNLFRGLCANFFNVAQEFMTCDEEVAMLHVVLDDARTKLTGYRAKMQSKSVADTHDSMAT
ncbi:protein FAR1-RELATED SEQUENCE 5-like [Arachis stenosperma]|uniref:protein FAR1-RELATED SEQUENCE 5-like n=1 Tax=Arachis stenosperma TaxID=217475 RepID=UPI0025ACB1A9|nr:protein FAR1-RELATED SEQUENCE 5-like [Arachis stenosperma]